MSKRVVRVGSEGKMKMSGEMVLQLGTGSGTH